MMKWLPNWSLLLCVFIENLHKSPKGERAMAVEISGKLKITCAKY
jgi:hypothetical protein